nr:MAG TPA: hypothetical protein [Caudoviricetes sp.]
MKLHSERENAAQRATGAPVRAYIVFHLNAELHILRFKRFYVPPMSVYSQRLKIALRPASGPTGIQ